MATGDTGLCGEPRLIGGGCGPGVTEPATTCEVSGDDTGPVSLDDSVLVGGGPCGHAPAPSLPWLLLAALWMIRRCSVLVLWLGLAAPPAHAQLDAQRLQIDDGGAFPALWEADLGGRWHGAGSLSLNAARNLAVLRLANGSERVVLDLVETWQGHVSWNIGGVARIGTTMPLHRVTFLSESVDGLQVGDWAFWLSIPLRDRRDRPPSSWTVRIDVPTGPGALYLGGPGSVTGTYAAGFRAGPLHGLVNLGAVLHAPSALPGVEWGPRLVYGTGLRAEPLGALWVTAEVEGSVPLRLRNARGSNFPLEGLLSTGVTVPPGVSAGAGVGMGFTNGIGSPSLRVMALVDVRPRPRRDADQDGVPDGRDACPAVPEDRDGYRDADGCPEPDNDGDGLLDGEDACPRRAEVFNLYQDADGCPDLVTEVTIDLAPVSGLASAWVRLGADAPASVTPEAPLVRMIGGEKTTTEVVAWGFETHRAELALAGEPLTHRVALQPLPWSTVRVQVVDPDGRPLRALVTAHDRPAVPADQVLKLPVGTHDLEIEALDHLPRVVAVEVRAVEEVIVRVGLQPSPVSTHGAQLRIPRQLDFALDDATIAEESAPMVDALAAWLLAHPEVGLLRIEGHADTRGTTRYNYALSLARAEAVRVALIGRGVSEKRLIAVGSGEATPSDDPDAIERRVEFLVLVWDDPTP